MVSTTSAQLVERLEDAGHRLTEARRRVCALIVDRPEGVSAEELVLLARGVGRATVYRTIDLLLQEQLICRVSEEGSSRYALSRPSHHHHLVCVSCGLVREFRDPSLERALRRLRVPGMKAVIGHEVKVQFLCESCEAQPRGKRPSLHLV